MQIRICDPKLEKEVKRLAEHEKRSVTKQIEALLHEAVLARELRRSKTNAFSQINRVI